MARAVARVGLGTVLVAVHLSTASDGWTVGYWTGTSGSTPLKRTMTEHWNGSTRTVVPSPTPSGATFARLGEIAGDAANDLWAVGSADGAPLIEHYDGSAWTAVAPPDAGGHSWLTEAITAVNGSDVGAAGVDQTSGAPLLLHWDGRSWTTSPTSASCGVLEAVTVTATASASAGTVAAVGYRGGGTTVSHTFAKVTNNG